jgi:murein L,D-transpeptidase YcbB/YkuD
VVIESLEPSAAKAQATANAAIEWIPYPQAVRAVLPFLFGDSWVGLAVEQERVVLKLGPSHPDWQRYNQLHAERELQIGRAERWLAIMGLVDTNRHGTRRVDAKRLQEALEGEARQAKSADHASSKASRKARPPSREKKFWPAAREAAFEWLIENGCPKPGDGNQAELERHVTEWLENHGHEAGEATVRRYVVRWINERRAELNA